MPAMFIRISLSILVVLLVAKVPIEVRASDDLPDWQAVIQANRDRLRDVESDESALKLFIDFLGPSLGLKDAAGTISAKGLPPKLSKELMVSEINLSAQRLAAALVVWDLSDSVVTAAETHAEHRLSLPQIAPSRSTWLNSLGSLPSFSTLLHTSPSGTDLSVPAATDSIGIALLAGRSMTEASQLAMTEWFRLNSWRDRIRSLRGQARLCGTWHWVVHNHQQHHQEQKLSLEFSPPGRQADKIPGLAEAIVLGDTVYLRWESGGRTQEDSLLFTKEAQRLEGTFVNSQGGWGSVSGKRTGKCAS
ncbi:hypothetical protein [Nitrospira sp. KM1]|uniref:hypothetical protein n=1 Tax=Nitrospira sp. KM1 TaxID=1936990 RepID=UPI001565C02D|nr:hypothetical protein [Nitrospira sp. KM1]